MVNCHAHLDRAYTATMENLPQAMALMEEKWVLNREIKKTTLKSPLLNAFLFA